MKFNILEFTLAAGAVQKYQMRGRHIRGLSGDELYSVEVDDDSPTEFQTGLAYTFPDFFNKVVVTNTAAVTQTIKIGISDGPIDDNRLVGQIDITGGIRQAGNRAVDHGAATVGTSAVLIAAENTSRNSILVQNLGAADIYIGGSGVTVANGLRVGKDGGSMSVTTQTAIYARSASAGNDVRYFEETM